MTNTFDLQHHLAQRVVARKKVFHFSKEFAKNYVPHKDPIAFSGGAPNHGIFPIDSLAINLIDTPFQTNSNTAKDFNRAINDPGNDPNRTAEDLAEVSANKYRNTAVSSTDILTVVTKQTGSVKHPFPLKDALQYQATAGTHNLVDFTKRLVQRLHAPARSDWSSVLNNGGGDGLHKIFNLLVNPGDVVLVEEFTFVPSVWSIENYGGEVHPVDLDLAGDGINPEKLAAELDGWASAHPGKPKPRVLYTVSTGQNPTGLTQSQATRKKIYAVAQKHDLIIVEDDPYGYIVYPEYNENFRNESVFDTLTVDQYVDDYIHKSYLNIDVDGRVLRSESFSKLLAPGIRLGFVVANQFFIDKIEHHTMLTTKFPSGVAQTVVNSVLEYWGGVDGYLAWGIKVCKVYEYRRNLFYETLRGSESYQRGYFSILDTRAGMFVSLVINFPKAAKTYSTLIGEVGDVSAQNGVNVVAAGKTMAVSDDTVDRKGNLVRLTFVHVSNDDQEIITGLARFDQSLIQVFEANKFT